MTCISYCANQNQIFFIIKESFEILRAKMYLDFEISRQFE